MAGGRSNFRFGNMVDLAAMANDESHWPFKCLCMNPVTLAEISRVRAESGWASRAAADSRSNFRFGNVVHDWVKVA